MRVILTTWVKHASPEDLRLVLVDLKRADWGCFMGLSMWMRFALKPRI
jgi:DNA segregation ATPase FtsK/SpoIIIE, S-DNA-T family